SRSPARWWRSRWPRARRAGRRRRSGEGECAGPWGISLVGTPPSWKEQCEPAVYPCGCDGRSVAEILVAGLAVRADLLDHVADACAGQGRPRQRAVERGALVCGVGRQALVLGPVGAERGLDVAGHGAQGLQVRQHVGGRASALLDAGAERADVRAHHVHHALREVVLAGLERAQRHHRGDDAAREADQEQEEVAGGGVARARCRCVQVRFPGVAMAGNVSIVAMDPSWLERFAGIDRLYGAGAVARLSRARVAVVGLGGVGSWAAEALARSAIGHLSLVDADDLCLSNTSRQLPALAGQYGRNKAQAMAERCRAINPAIDAVPVEAFLTPSNLEALLGDGFDLVLDACDSFRTKVEAIAWCRRRKQPIVTVGAAGGRTDPTQVRVRDLSRTEHDAMLSLIRKKLRGEFNF